jgi:hypothetical protein
MKTTIKYLLLFPVLTFTTISFEGNQVAFEPFNNSLFNTKNDNVTVSKPEIADFLCYNYTTSVFKHAPESMNENLIKSDLLFKEKLNALNETVKKILIRKKQNTIKHAL